MKPPLFWTYELIKMIDITRLPHVFSPEILCPQFQNDLFSKDSVLLMRGD